MPLPSSPARASAVAAVLVLAAVVAAGQSGAATAWAAAGLVVVGALVCLRRAARLRAERASWAAIGLGLGCLALTAAPLDGAAVSAISLAAYPLLWIGAARVFTAGELRSALWLDGAATALTVAALTAAFLVGPIAGDAAATATPVARTIGDLLLLALIAGVLAATGWRPDRRWALLGGGVALAALTELAASLREMGDAGAGGLLAVGRPAAALLIGAAAVLPRTGKAEGPARPWRALVMPAVTGAAALGILLTDHFHRLSLGPVLLATGALVAVVARATMSFVEHGRQLEDSREEALLDGLTGLGNRRRLERDLATACAAPDGTRMLVLFDLDGFKGYNDTFGHPAGDALLVRLGARLAGAVRPSGSAYRMGGDEFCALLDVGDRDAVAPAEATAAALAEHGEGFAVTASHGAAVLEPGAAPGDVLRTADQRMYAEKEGRRPKPGQQARELMLSILHGADPALHGHVRDVTDLVVPVARRLGLAGEELDALVRASELHDIGKMAVPAEVLDKPGPLSEDEWRFMRQHPLVGERILGAAPAMAPVARLIRHSHERWDGGGYPDGLAGPAAPLGARILAVCDAYDAMTSLRAYRRALDMDGALAELRAHAGTQFDPEVVDALCGVAEGIRDALSGAVGAGEDAAPAARVG